jgi:hypothetical protein
VLCSRYSGGRPERGMTQPKAFYHTVLQQGRKTPVPMMSYEFLVSDGAAMQLVLRQPITRQGHHAWKATACPHGTPGWLAGPASVSASCQ